MSFFARLRGPFFLALLAIVLAVGASAQVEPKWIQPPDLSDLGMDVNATMPLILADDFECKVTGPLTNIVVWGSWYHDALPDLSPEAIMFNLSFHADIPATNGMHSMPGEVLWFTNVAPGDFSVEMEAADLAEGWMDPPQGLYEPMADTICWRYTFSFDPETAFRQTGSTNARVVYWLDVQAMPMGPELFGWKTTTLENRWNDDAVWGMGEEPFQGPWNELRYLPPHPFAGESVDLAFALYGADEPPEDMDWGDAPAGAAAPGYPTLALNNGARHVIGGPWLGGPGDAPDPEPDGQPDPNALGDDYDIDPANPPPNYDDENGVWFPPLIQGVPTNFTVIVSGGGGAVQGWLDINGDNTWQDPAELILAVSLPDGTNSLIPITVPTNSVAGQTFARFRISSRAGLLPTGAAADGEVEDIEVRIDSGYPDWCNLQSPPATTNLAGVPTETIYGRVRVDGVTGTNGSRGNVTAQLGYGPDGSDPATNPGAWTWVSAAFNQVYGSDDEYMATLTVPTPGVYDYACRFSRNGLQWLYGDLDGSQNGYDTGQAGDLTVDAPECPKWLQRADCDYGLNLLSWGYYDVQSPEERIPVALVADDWLCDGRPVTAVRWWGSHVGYDGPAEDPVVKRPDAFRLTWWTDVPTNFSPTNWSMPGTQLMSVVVAMLPYGMEADAPGLVEWHYYCTTPLDWAIPPPAVPFEHEYEYKVVLPEEWREKEGRVYWLSIEALFSTEGVGPEFQWGWKTTPPRWNWNDDAVTWSGIPPYWTEMTYPPMVYPWGEIENHPYADESVNLAFELLTDICPARCKKWSEPPDMFLGMNMDSWEHFGAPAGTVYPLRADDFVSDGRPITDIHWWGSYIGWESQRPGSEEDPVPPPGGSFRPVGFNLSWHDTSPEGSCTPGPLKTNLFVAIDKCHEVFYGTVFQEWMEPPNIFEHEYQYYVDLLDPEVAGEPWYELAGTHYWLNVQAVFSQDFVPAPEEGSHTGWGWKIAPEEYTGMGMCPSAVSGANGAAGSWVTALLPFYPAYPRSGQPFDLAFELTTTNIPPTNGFAVVTDVEFTDMSHDVPADRYRMWSSGYCGCGKQVLQVSTNLVHGAWTDRETNALPRNVNLWIDEPISNKTFYRVKQVN